MEESRLSNRSCDTIQTVQLPKALQAAYAIDGLTFRPFGIAENDLDVDFSQPSLPALVTDVLECCGTAGDGKCPERNLLWQLQVGTRIECLLRIINLSGAFAAPFALRCRNSDCGEPLEVELSLDDLLSLQDEPGDLLTVQCGEQTLALRKPIGADQREWAGGIFEDDLAAIKSMVQALIVRDDESTAAGQPVLLTDESLARVDRVMQDGDALVNFSLELVCPHCESHSEFEMDLQALAIERLEHCQRRLLATVHRLAKHYHWSEQQIFAVPAWRRTHYLKMLEAEQL
ncbi:MAG TPA: hypothetical protein VN476_02400 [Pyrinomonadaceae bacterium]|nr:hypothetical protein [Pyrinomonadaceae bacterium]